MRFHLLLLAAVAHAATDAPPASTATQQSILQQMEASLRAQRESIARQATGSSAKPFFLLSRPQPPSPGFAPALPGQAPPAPSIGSSQPADCAPLPEEQLQRLIQSAAQKTDLSPDLLRGVARQESGYRPCAVSVKGAMGLMQLMPGTARSLGVNDPFNPEQSMDGAARLLRMYLDAYG